MEVKVLDFNVDWKNIKNACRKTISLGNSEKEPTSEWKRKLLICRHSPLRVGNILIEINDIPFYVMGHLVRHNVGVTPFVTTSREDRTGVPRDERSQTDLVSMQMILNIESLLNISEKRLCQCADKETIKVWKAVIEEIAKFDEDLTFACVPSGIALGGCPESFGTCNYCNNILEGFEKEEIIDIQKRYTKFNEIRKGRK